MLAAPAVSPLDSESHRCRQVCKDQYWLEAKVALGYCWFFDAMFKLGDAYVHQVFVGRVPRNLPRRSVGSLVLNAVAILHLLV